MPEPAGSWAPRADETVECGGCGDEVPVAHTAYRSGDWFCVGCDR